MKSRMVMVALIFVLLLGMAMSVSAQDMTCFNLPAADCAVITQASANTSANVKSFDMDYSVTFSAAGLAALDPTMSDITASITGTATVVLTGSGQVPVAVSTSLDVTASGIPDTPDVSQHLEAVVVDDVAYVQDPTTMEWTGIPLADELSNNPLGVNPADLAGAGSVMDPQTMAMLQPFLSIPGFINYERLADESMMDQNTSPFSLTVDITTLLNSDVFQQTLNAALQSAQSSTDQSTAMMAAMLPAILPSIKSQLNVTQWVGTDDNFIHKVAFDLGFNMDLAAAMGATGTPPIDVNLHFEGTLNNINGSQSVTAPEGATMMPSTSGS